MQLAPLDLSSTARWTQDGAFPDRDGNAVRAYDDVVLLEPTLPENDGTAAYIVPEGTVGTVLFHCADAEGVLQLELYWRPGAFVIGYANPTHVRLHQTNEQKHPR
jgi:hypothetical protein